MNGRAPAKVRGADAPGEAGARSTTPGPEAARPLPAPPVRLPQAGREAPQTHRPEGLRVSQRATLVYALLIIALAVALGMLAEGLPAAFRSL